MITLLLVLYPLYFSLGEGISPSLPFGSQNIFQNPSLIGSELNPSYTLSLFGTNLALTNNVISVYLYNDVMEAEGDSLNKNLKDKILNYMGSKWTLNHISYFSPFSFSIKNFSLGIRLIQGTFFMIPKEWIELSLYGNELNKIYEINKDNSGFQFINLIELKAGYGNRIGISKDLKLLYGLSFSFLISGPYADIDDINVTLNTNRNGFTGNDLIKIRIDSTFGNTGYSIDIGFGVEYKKRMGVSLGFRNLFSGINFSKGAVSYLHQGQLDSFYIGRDVNLDSLFVDNVDTIPGAFKVKLPLMLSLSGYYKEPKGKFILYFLYEQGFKNTAFSSKIPKFSIGGEYYVTKRIPLRLGITLGGYEGFSLSTGFGIISRKFSSINFGISQHKGLFSGARGISTSFLIEFHSPLRGELKGKIIDSITGKPIANANFILKDKDGKLITELKSDNEGRVEYKLEAGEYIYEVSAAGFYTKKGFFKIKTGKRTEFKVMLKTKYGILTLKTIDKSSQKPIGNVAVKLTLKGKEKVFRTDTSGIIKFKLLEGEYVFIFEHPDYLRRVEQFSVTSGMIKEVEVNLTSKWGIVKGKVFNAKTNKSLRAFMEVYTENKDTLIKEIKILEDGNYMLRLRNGIYFFKVKAEKYIPQAAYVVVKGGDTTYKNFPMLKEKMVFTFRNIYFDFNKATIRPESYPILDSIAIMLKENPTVIVEIGGHTDERGSRSYNKRLSQARADAVRMYFIEKHGIDPSRLIAVGYGEDRPVIRHAKTEAEHQMNRRVEFKILGEKKN